MIAHPTWLYMKLEAGGSWKLSAVATGHKMWVGKRHYEKVGEDFEQVHESYKRFHPAFVEGW